MSPLLQVEGLHLVDSGYWRLRGVDLALEERSITVVLGGACSGKTALLESIAGLRPIKEGRVRFGGAELGTAAPAARARLGIRLAAQRPRVWEELSVRGNLLLGRANSRPGRRPSLRRVLDLIPELRAAAWRKAGQLGRRERALLEIGRALLDRPALLLLDEPCQEIEPERVSEIVRAAADDGTAVLMTERRYGVAPLIADAAVLLQNGRVVRSGDTARLRADPVVSAACLGEVTDGL